MIKKFFSIIAVLFFLLSFQNFVQASKIHFTYQAHIENYGWLNPVKNGQATGSTGKNLRMEAVLINLMDGAHNMINYSAHVQNIGWQAWQISGGVAGTVGQNLRMEAIRIKLVRGYDQIYDIYYRTHIQNGGWLGWAKNGEPAGTTGASLRMEALQIMLVPKGQRFKRGGRAFFEKITVAGSVI